MSYCSILFYSLSRRENLSHIFFSTCTSCDKEGSTRHSRFWFFFPSPVWVTWSVLSPTVYVALLFGRLYLRKCLFSLATSTAKTIFSPTEQRGEKNQREGTDEEEEGRAVLYKASARGSSLWFKSICGDAWRLNCEYKTVMNWKSS